MSILAEAYLYESTERKVLVLRGTIMRVREEIERKKEEGVDVDREYRVTRQFSLMDPVTPTEFMEDTQEYADKVMAHVELIKSLVPKHYEMDPETEDLLFDGTRLLAGMKVLIDNDGMRIRPIESDLEDDSQITKAKKYNRWCTVDEIRYGPQFVHFIGIYDDGSKVKWSEPLGMSWYVKKDSIPTAEKQKEEDEKLVADMEVIIRDGIDKVWRGTWDNIPEAAKKISLQILDIL